MEAEQKAKLEKTEIEVGFVPILCSAPLILAHVRGIFENNGLHVNLKPASGWSGIKELISYEKIDAAHMLSPMPLACNQGIDGKKAEIKLAAIQNVNGQAMTLARKHLGITSVRDMSGFTFGVPYRFSMHYYLLCHYLAQYGVHPLKDVTIIEVAPPNMPYYLEQGWVDGMFSPEPFNQIPVTLGTGFIHILSRDIWEGHPCCSFATTQVFAERNPNTYMALLRSIIEAEMILHSADGDERRVIARSISDPEHLNLDDSLPAEQVLSGEFTDGKGGHHQVRDRIDFVPQLFADYGSWMLLQMQRWGQLCTQIDYQEIVESTFDSEGARDVATAIGYSPDRHSSTGNIGFDGKDPFAYMKALPFCEFQAADARKADRKIPSPVNERLAEVNDQLAGVVGGKLDVAFSVEGDDELGRLEELLGELVLNTKFARLLLTDRNEKLRVSASELQIREGDLRATLASIGDGVIGTDTNRRVTRLNKAAEQLTGWTENAAIGRSLDEVFVILNEKTREPAPDPVAQVLATGQIEGLANHTVLVGRDGIERPIADSAAPIREASGDVTGVVLVFRDQTAERQAAEELRASKELLGVTLRSIGDAVIATDDKGRVTFMNTTAEELTGWNQEEAAGNSLDEVFDIKNEETGDRVESPLKRVFQEGLVVGLANHTKLVRRDGTELPIADSGAPIKDDAGEIIGAVLVFQDITERRKAEEALRLKNKVFEDSIAALSIADTEGIITQVNPAFLKLWGHRSKEDAIGGSVGSFFVNEEDAGPVLEALGSTGRWEGEFLARRADGSSFISRGLATAMRNECGELIGYQSANLDVSEQKKAEQELRERRDHLEDLVEVRTAQVNGANEILLKTLTSESETDVARTCLSVAEKLVGSKFGFIGEINEAGRFDTMALSDPGWQACRILKSDAVVTIKDMELRGIWARVLKDGQPLIVNTPASHPDSIGIPEGHPSITSFLGVPLARGGKTFGMIALANKESGFDEKDQEAIEMLSISFVEALFRKRAENRTRKMNLELISTNKELESFAYSVSHDLRAPLRGINGFSQALLEDYGDQLDDTGKDYLERVSEAARRMGRLIDDILQLSRLTRSEMHYETVDLSSIVEKTTRELRQSEPMRQVEIVIASGLSANGDAALLETAMRNLLGNAWKFTVGKDHAKIEVGIEETKDGDAYFVRDNGAGFDMSYTDKLFSAFQRLHDTTEFSGTGIGLATVQRVIQRHGGRVWGTGEVNEGATFYFTLPK